MHWRTGKEIDAHIDKLIFEVRARHYKWDKKLSILPRRCYWTGKFIRPFSYAMIAHWPENNGMMKNAIMEESDDIKISYRWVSMSQYVFLQLTDKL